VTPRITQIWEGHHRSADQRTAEQTGPQAPTCYTKLSKLAPVCTRAMQFI
jgi:hypothetical protein